MLRHALRPAVPVRRAVSMAYAKRSFASYPPHEVVGLPALSPTMESGNLAKWNMKEGDRITAGDIICEIETDKAVVDYEATDDMFLARILVPEGTQNIVVGQPMMVVCEDEESLAALKDFKIEDAGVVVPAPAAKSPEEIPPKKEQVPVDPVSNAPVVPSDFLVTSQTTQKTVPGPAIPAAPVKAAAPAPTPAAAAPVATTTVFAEKWGLGIKKSPISLSLAKKQQTYIDLYGLTGTTPVSFDKK
ncbi:Dihydrolipoyllysine-residue acetyltransferase component of pyruvate dehydrogenase complex, partial [Globisporangium splendens]